MLIEKYFTEIYSIMEQVLDTQRDHMNNTARMIYNAVKQKNSIFAFGCNHAGLLAQELIYRSGGLVVINPIMAPGVSLDASPIGFTTDMERLEGYGRIIIENTKIKKGDVLIIHSVSGRNAVSIDVAIHAKAKGALIIVLTNLNTSTASASRHSSGKRLFEVGDLVLDNCGHFGDAVMEIHGLGQRFAPSSTVIGAAILNAIIAEVIGLFVNNGMVPPVFISSNVDGGDKHNKNILEQYKENIFY